jgi:hypothetical protein
MAIFKETNAGWLITQTVDSFTYQVQGVFAQKPVDQKIRAQMPGLKIIEKDTMPPTLLAHIFNISKTL